MTLHRRHLTKKRLLRFGILLSFNGLFFIALKTTLDIYFVGFLLLCMFLGVWFASSRLFSVFYKKSLRLKSQQRNHRVPKLVKVGFDTTKTPEIHQVNDIVSPQVICRQKIKTIIMFHGFGK